MHSVVVYTNNLVGPFVLSQGWHSAGDLIPWHTTAREGMLGTWAPYLSHIMSILRNMDIDIACLQSDRAAGFIQYIEQVNSCQVLTQ